MYAHHICRRRVLLALASGGAACALAAPPAMAQTDTTTVPLRPAGATALTLDQGTAGALQRLGVTVRPAGPATTAGQAIRFPITGGTVDPRSFGPAVVRHRGGLQLSSGRTRVRLTNFTIRAGRTATLSAAVGRSRATIADLDASGATITRPRIGGPSRIGTRVAGVAVTLNATGAKALNAAFHTRAFASGLKLGTAVVDARPSRLILENGSTALTLDSGTAGLLTGAGIAPAVIAPATAPSTGTFAFPVTPSRITTSLSAGTIGHTGGMSLTKGPATVALTDFDIRLGRSNTLAATLNGGGDKAAIVDLDVSGATVQASGATGLVLSGVRARLNRAASGALTSAFGTPSTAGAALGTAVITANAR